MPTKLATDNLAARYLHKEVAVAPSIILNVAQKLVRLGKIIFRVLFDEISTNLHPD